MGDEAEKRNTDCVYFLASPLTCKKGADCEYRHSEAARVNPRDCWYWLSGNCLNASCSFRHPPLDGRPGVSAANNLSQPAGASSSTPMTMTSTAASNIPSTSANVSAPPSASKSTVPCFFFSQGYCAKGVKCPFLHGPPTQYRKEATTYQRPQVNDQPVNGEGIGAVKNTKDQIQDRKSAPQVKAPVRAALHSQEGEYIPSNVYRLSASGGPTPSNKHLSGNAGEKVEQTSQVGKPKLNDPFRRTQLAVDSGIQQGHFSNKSSEQFTSGEKVALKGQPMQLDSSRTGKQIRQSTVSYVGRNNDALISPEIPDSFYEPEGQQIARELHADDLRNHLKRKKNDGVQVSQHKDFRLASRAVTVTEPKDFVAVNSKKAKQEKESSTFSGPKSLAQIKAEKSKAATEGSLKAVTSIDDCRNINPNSEEGKDILVSTVEHPVSCMPEFRKDLPGDHPSTLLDINNNIGPKSFVCSGASESGGTSQKSWSGVVISNSNGLSSKFVPSVAFDEAEMAADDSAGVIVAPMSKRQHSLMNKTTSAGNKYAHAFEGTHPEMGPGPADVLMENGSEALENVGDMDYAMEYEEEDDFTRKLGRYLS